jgi:hypothetical protein
MLMEPLMRTVLAVLLLVAVTAPASAQICQRRGVETRCSDGSATKIVNGRWLYRPSPEARIVPAGTWPLFLWPFSTLGQEIRVERRPRLVSP